MIKKSKTKSISDLTVGDFFKNHGEDLKLELISSERGFKRAIGEPAVNRPGLALSGFFTYFAKQRVQVFGNSEISYLKKLPADKRISRVEELCSRGIPCIVVSRHPDLPADVLQVCEENGVPFFRTPMATMHFINKATLALARDFAETTTVHGCMIDFRGVGVLIMGKSGSGKSETAIGLIERGGALVADDSVKIRNVYGELTASTVEFSRGYIEMRGIGIVNVANLYGLGSIRPDAKLDLIVFLRPHADLNEVDRLGIQRKTHDLLGVKVPYVEIPVAPGRDTARLVAVTALELQLRRMGYDMAEEFNQRLLSQLAAGQRPL